MKFMPTVFFLIIANLCPSAEALVRLTKGCPGTKGAESVTWTQYLMASPQNYVGIEFRTAKAFEPSTMGAVRTNRCYAVSYSPSEGYRSWESRVTAQGGIGPKDSDVPVEKLKLGDPSSFEINVGGHIFLYDRYGRIYDDRARVVALILCHITTDCGAY